MYITFLMPGLNRKPVGGYKIVYEYANRFVSDGYEVAIVFPVSIFFVKRDIFYKLRSVLVYLYARCFNLEKMSYKWFPLDKKIRLSIVPSLSERFVPKSDVYVATGVATSCYLNEYSNASNKYYFIQHFETWATPESFVLNTYQFKLKKIVIAPWLLDIVRSVGEEAQLIYNGLDFSYFGCYQSVERRNKFNIAVMYHKATWKGFSDSYKALQEVKIKFPQLHVNVFGAEPCPIKLPSWFTYYLKPDQKTHNMIYNESAIYISASFYEGFGLTVAEAMQCGCVVACTDNGGFRAMCKDGETALLSPIKSPYQLADNIIKLIADDELRYKLSRNALISIRKFTWESAYGKMKNLLTGC